MIGRGSDKVGALVDELRRDKEVIPYPTYGYRKKKDENIWVIPVRVWVNKARRLPVSDEVIGLFASDMGDLSAEDTRRLRSRLQHFVADDDSGEAVSVKFDDDPDDQTHVLPGATDFNGLIRHNLEIPAGKARELLDAQQSTSGWLSFTDRLARRTAFCKSPPFG